MKNMIMNILVKFVSADAVAELFAKLIAKLLNYAAKKGGKHWDAAKTAMNKTAVWINLFNEVYEDDKLTSEEEAKIADAIKSQTSVDKIADILKK